MTTIKRGFTLIELLVVIGIIAILFAVVLVAVNPAQRFAQTRDARRVTDVNSMMNAVLNYTVDTKGTLPANLAGYVPTSTAGAKNLVRMVGNADSGSLGNGGLANNWACGGPVTATTGKYTLTGNTAGNTPNASANTGWDLVACATAATCDVYGLGALGIGVIPAYLASTPFDPVGGTIYTAANSGYGIQNVCNDDTCSTGLSNLSGRIKVVACRVETDQNSSGVVDTADTIEVVR